MNGREHFRIFSVVIIPIVIIYILLKVWMYIPLLFMSFFIVDADEDQKYAGGKYHRSFITHSIIWPLFISLCIWLPFYSLDGVSFMMVFITLCIPNSIHLLADIYSENPQGKYNIMFFERRTTVPWTIAWLIVNAVAPIGIYLIFL